MKTFSLLLTLLMIIAVFSCKNKDNAATKEKPVVVEPKWEDYKGDYTKKAEYFVKDAGLALKTRLTKAIVKGGIENAINVCNEVAQKMMDSISTANGIVIKRTSLNVRNTKNAPDRYDIDMLNNYNKLKAEGKGIASDGIEQENRQVKLYVPIITEKLCLQCHGTPDTDVKPNIVKLIKKLYPEDKATGYKEGDIRGAWVVQMEK
jgi:hypothetical protein